MAPLDPNSESLVPPPAEPLSPSAPEPAPAPLMPAVEPAAEGRPQKENGKKDKHDKNDKENEQDKDRAREKEKDKEKDREKGRDKKKKKKQKEEFRKVDPWQRYKALADTLKESQDLVDLADHKTRFALMIMGALNAAILLVGTRSELLASVPLHLKPWLYLYFGVYATIAIYFLLQAIESLRPRSVPVLPRKTAVSEKAESLGLRFFADALRYDLPTYAEAWQSVRVSQLNAEISAQIHTIARINKAKYAAVARLYFGLQAITVLTTGLLIAFAAVEWNNYRVRTGDEAGAAAEPDDPTKLRAGKHKKGSESEEVPLPKIKPELPKMKPGKPSKGGAAILGEPERLEAPGVREPSGIAYHPGRGTFFLVGHEGSLVELSGSGKLVGRIPATGNLEDVAVHTPSGRLVVLSEKESELIVYDPATGQETGRFKLDDEALLGQPAEQKNRGFEGLAFRREDGHPGGGVFYLAHQRGPALVVEFAFDPMPPSGAIGPTALIRRIVVPNRDDLTAVTYDAPLDRLFVIADSEDRLVMLNRSGLVEAEIILPAVTQEGLSFDPEGNLWIADDRGHSLFVFRGARARIQEAMKKPPVDASE